MTGEARLIDTVVLVHAYTVSDDKKHRVALGLIERVWGGEEATTTLQNLCEFFFVVTHKVEKPIQPSTAETIVKGILTSSQWRVIDRSPETLLKAIALVKLHRASFWDALIAAGMLENGISSIVTENERDFKKIPGVTIINPFRARAKR
jgi:predicted nucleic acid-binding protein